jgi:hypothetical protein
VTFVQWSVRHKGYAVGAPANYQVHDDIVSWPRLYNVGSIDKAVIALRYLLKTRLAGYVINVI